MNAINTTLTPSGNSVAVRLPKDLLRMSGLGTRVQLEAKEGKIIISKATNARESWGAQIKALVIANGDPTKDFDDMPVAAMGSVICPGMAHLLKIGKNNMQKFPIRPRT